VHNCKKSDQLFTNWRRI